MKKIAIGAAVLIASVYFWPEVSDFGWKFYTRVNSEVLFPPSERMVITIAGPKVAIPIAVPAKRAKAPVEHWRTVTIVQEVPAPVILVPDVVEPQPQAVVKRPMAPLTTKSDPYESKTKNGIRAVGRFLKFQK